MECVRGRQNKASRLDRHHQRRGFLHDRRSRCRSHNLRVRTTGHLACGGFVLLVLILAGTKFAGVVMHGAHTVRTRFRHVGFIKRRLIARAGDP